MISVGQLVVPQPQANRATVSELNVHSAQAPVHVSIESGLPPPNPPAEYPQDVRQRLLALSGTLTKPTQKPKEGDKGVMKPKKNVQPIDSSVPSTSKDTEQSRKVVSNAPVDASTSTISVLERDIEPPNVPLINTSNVQPDLVTDGAQNVKESTDSTAKVAGDNTESGAEHGSADLIDDQDPISLSDSGLMTVSQVERLVELDEKHAEKLLHSSKPLESSAISLSSDDDNDEIRFPDDPDDEFSAAMHVVIPIKEPKKSPKDDNADPAVPGTRSITSKLSYRPKATRKRPGRTSIS